MNLPTDPPADGPSGERADDLAGFLADVAQTVERDAVVDEIEPDFEAMLARAGALAERERAPVHDPAFTSFICEVATHVESDHEHDEPVPDFLAVVTRAHTLAPNVIPQSAVDEVGHYAPIIALRHAARLKTGQHDPALDAFVGDVRGHIDHDLVREDTAVNPAANDTAHNPGTRRGFGLMIAAGLVMALGLGAGLATMFDLGGGLWSPEGDTPHEAMLSPRTTPGQSSELADPPANRRVGRAANDPGPKPEPVPEPSFEEPTPQVPLEVTPEHAPARRKHAAKQPSRRDRLATLEREANAKWRAGKLDEAEASFRKIIALDGRGSWGETAYGELFTLQRQRGRSSVAVWKAYLQRFPNGRFADDAQAGLCRRAADDDKPACWSDYLEARPQGSFRAQAKRELDSTRTQERTQP